LENLRERHRTTEQRLKDSETSIELTYKAKINIMEEKNQSLMDKIAIEKHVYSQVQHLEEQLAHKATALQRAVENAKHAEISLHETMGQLKSRDEVLLSKDEEIKQLETRVVKLENDVKKERQASSRCKVLEAEVTSKQTEIKMINQSLNDAHTEIDDLQSKIEQLSRELNDKNKDILDIDMKLKQALKMNMSERGFNDIIASMQSEITDMEGSLLTERSARKVAEEDCETFQIKIRSLESTLKEKQSLIVEKEADIKNLQKIVNFDQVKSTQLEQLEIKMSEITHALNVEIQANRMSQRELEKKDIKIQGLEFSVQTKEKTIQDLENTVKANNVSQVSDRIMNSTIQQLETQLKERDGMITTRNDKIKSVEKTLQDSLARVRKLENDLKDHASEAQEISFQKQNAEREAVKLKTTVQSLEGKLNLFEKQNETMEQRTKLLIFEKHEAVNKLEMLEKIVQDMAESTIDSASSVKEQERLTTALNKANMQIQTLSADLEKSNVTVTMLRNSLAESDLEIKKLSSESHASHVAKKAVDMMVTNLKSSKDKSQNKELASVISRSNTATEMSVSHSMERTSGGVSSQGQLNRGESGRQNTPPSTNDDVQAALSHLENANGITGRKHTKMSTLSEITDFINSTAKDIEKISEKKKDMREGIERYTTDFKAKNNRLPTAAEKSAAPDNIFINYQQLSHILKKKSAKLADAEEQFRKLKEEQSI
jgi:exonuclease SbcC